MPTRFEFSGSVDGPQELASCESEDILCETFLYRDTWSHTVIILADGESPAMGYVTPSSLENVPEEKLC